VSGQGVAFVLGNSFIALSAITVRLGATILFAIFALAAAAGHIQQIMCCRNYAPGHAGLTLWFFDIFVPGVIVVMAALCRGERV